MDDADAAAIASWHATAVRVPLNEDCWLGINGQPNSSPNPPAPLTMAGYRQAVQDYVTALNNAGLYVILDLHWSAPSVYVADGQRPMPDSHSVDFWASVASTFKTNPAVVFDAFNEPYSPDAVNDPGALGQLELLEDRQPRLLPARRPMPATAGQQRAPLHPVGMQSLVDAIRATGAPQPILLGGLSYSNDLSQWLANEPSDPDHQLAASYHNYEGQQCSTQACWDSTIAPVAAQVPVVTGEFDEDNFAAPHAPTGRRAHSTLHELGRPARRQLPGVGLGGAHCPGDQRPGLQRLLPDQRPERGRHGRRRQRNGTARPPRPRWPARRRARRRLLGCVASARRSRPAGPRSASRCGPPRTAPPGSAADGQLVRDQSAATHGRHRVSLGSVRFKLAASRSKTVVLELSRASQTLLRQHKLKVQITVALMNAGRRRQ